MPTAFALNDLDELQRTLADGTVAQLHLWGGANTPQELAVTLSDESGEAFATVPVRGGAVLAWPDQHTRPEPQLRALAAEAVDGENLAELRGLLDFFETQVADVVAARRLASAQDAVEVARVAARNAKQQAETAESALSDEARRLLATRAGDDS